MTWVELIGIEPTTSLDLRRVTPKVAGGFGNVAEIAIHAPPLCNLIACGETAR
jgi:hypothetical protein